MLQIVQLDNCSCKNICLHDLVEFLRDLVEITNYRHSQAFRSISLSIYNIWLLEKGIFLIYVG